MLRDAPRVPARTSPYLHVPWEFPTSDLDGLRPANDLRAETGFFVRALLAVHRGTFSRRVFQARTGPSHDGGDRHDARHRSLVVFSSLPGPTGVRAFCASARHRRRRSSGGKGLRVRFFMRVTKTWRARSARNAQSRSCARPRDRLTPLPRVHGRGGRLNRRMTSSDAL